MVSFLGQELEQFNLAGDRVMIKDSASFIEVKYVLRGCYPSKMRAVARRAASKCNSTK